jgi:hypothetical protein
MSPAILILRAVARSMRRDAGSFFALKGNNFFLFVLLLIGGNLAVGLPPQSAYPFLLLLGFLILFPLSSDPLAKVPPVRLAAWPLANSHRALLRFASVALSPVFWIAVILFLRAAPLLAIAFLSMTAAMQAALAFIHRGSLVSERRIASPGIPGKLGPLMAAAIRQLFSVLDSYVALLIAIGGCIYRFAYKSPDPAAYPIFSLLIVLALSTYAQTLFGLDSPSAWTRYSLLPLTRREILFAKDASFLGLLFLLTLPLNPVAGMSFAFVSLSIGRLSVVARVPTQRRWRFCGGRFAFGVLQITLGCALGIGAIERTETLALIPLLGYILSTAVAPNHRKQTYPTC